MMWTSTQPPPATTCTAAAAARPSECELLTVDASPAMINQSMMKQTVNNTIRCDNCTVTATSCHYIPHLHRASPACTVNSHCRYPRWELSGAGWEASKNPPNYFPDPPSSSLQLRTLAELAWTPQLQPIPTLQFQLIALWNAAWLLFIFNRNSMHAALKKKNQFVAFWIKTSKILVLRRLKPSFHSSARNAR